MKIKQYPDTQKVTNIRTYGQLYTQINAALRISRGQDGFRSVD